MDDLGSKVNNVSLSHKGRGTSRDPQRRNGAAEGVSFSPEEISALMAALGLALAILQRKAPGALPHENAVTENRPAVPPVPVSDSIQQDYIVCLEDGVRVKYLKSHLKRFNLSPDQYRARWGLPPDYPMVAPGFSERRAELAKRVKPHLFRQQNKPGAG